MQLLSPGHTDAIQHAIQLFTGVGTLVVQRGYTDMYGCAFEKVHISVSSLRDLCICTVESWIACWLRQCDPGFTTQIVLNNVGGWSLWQFVGTRIIWGHSPSRVEPLYHRWRYSDYCAESSHTQCVGIHYTFCSTCCISYRSWRIALYDSGAILFILVSYKQQVNSTDMWV